MSSSSTLDISAATDVESSFQDGEGTFEEKAYTLVFVRKQKSKEILLGMKLRGFGKGKWNGFGGKIEPGETIEEAAVRELHEESNLTIKTSDLQKRALITFTMQESLKLMHVHVFETFTYVCEEKESDEMKPQWFFEKDIPFDQTWPDVSTSISLLITMSHLYHSLLVHHISST